MARMEDDGIDQAQYKVKEKMMTDVYTKIIADLSYTNYINTYVSITSSRCATFRGTYSYIFNYLFSCIDCIRYLYLQNDTELSLEFERNKKKKYNGHPKGLSRFLALKERQKKFNHKQSFG